MELRTLKYFVVVAEELNITKAAEKLNMCQPPLSSQIKNLEDELGSRLFVRGKRQLQLTETGQLLYRRAKEIINLSDKAEEEITSMTKGEGGTISLGVVDGMAADLTSGWIAGFREKHPLVHFRISQGNSDELIEKMRSGLISLAVITAPYDQLLLNSFSIAKEPMVAILREDHPFANTETSFVELVDLIDQPLIVPSRPAKIEAIRKWFRPFGAEAKIVCETDNLLAAAALTRHNLGVSIFPKTNFILDNGLVAKEIRGMNNLTEYLFVWRKGHPLPTVEEDFIDYIKEIKSIQEFFCGLFQYCDHMHPCPGTYTCQQVFPSVI